MKVASQKKPNKDIIVLTKTIYAAIKFCPPAMRA